ncbi:MAG: carbohydrate ABC transporter permease [Spirochaetota bacterium]
MAIKLTPGKIFTMVILSAVALSMAFPFYWMMVGSLKTIRGIYTFPPAMFVTDPQWGNYAEAWRAIPILKYMLNSIIMSAGIVLFQLVFSCLAAYAYSKLEFFGRDLLFYITIACLVVPEQVRFIPLYIAFSKLHMLNTFWVLILPFAGSAFSIFFIRQMFMTINNAYIDAATLEGCNVLQVLWHVMVPMSKPTLITVALFNFISHWNDYFWPLVMTSSDDVRTLPVGLAMMMHSGEFMPPWNISMAANMFLVVPTILLFIFVQKQIMEALTFSPMK